MLSLYQFPHSHYCEKVRWALAYKKLAHNVINLLPGVHSLTTRKFSSSSSLPILLHDGQVVQNSADIISYLDEHFPDQMLTPSNAADKQVALAWEAFADKSIGIPVRILCYHTLLQHPDLLIPMMAEKGPWYSRFLLKLMYPKLDIKMRELMGINEASAQTALIELDAALAKLTQAHTASRFLVGGQFSRADLSVAALLSPLCKTITYPEPLNTLISQRSNALAFVYDDYRDYRL
ncbi:glutathione S-transferase family protein [Methylocucumis oryzae]|uniref:GST N-terminal domain-containing protein n=1 Tax=Methylocucumis oryzae TaxID=1632867 RepID=A0A0F3IIV5_9GAMM|nr:glutathione S-transferase family protein [Methylocucumis oryzae]KJV05449.1 hypothetical protein VZ94_18165 [Methylocucumis oryzae]